MGEHSKAGAGDLSTGGFFMTVAIIMRSMNEQPYVEQVFEMLRRQTYSDFTVYNVDSGSTDGTWECVCTENPRAEKRRRIRPDQYIPGKVLNETIELTREPIIVLLNADAIPLSSTWLEELIKPLMNGKAEATLSRQVARKDARFIVRNDYEALTTLAVMRKSHWIYFLRYHAVFRELYGNNTRFPLKGMPRIGLGFRNALRGVRDFFLCQVLSWSTLTITP